MSGLDVKLTINRETEYSGGRGIDIGWRFQVDASGPGEIAALAAKELRRVADELDGLAKNPPFRAAQGSKTE